jgi:hypothetical protein
MMITKRYKVEFAKLQLLIFQQVFLILAEVSLGTQFAVQGAPNNKYVALPDGSDSVKVPGVSPSADGDVLTAEGYVIPLGKVTTQLPNGTQYGVNNLDQVVIFS